MPNYCDNRLRLEAASDNEIEKILDFIKSEKYNFDFEKVVPLNGDNSSRHAFDAWGCGSDAGETSISSIEDGLVEIEFTTAWSPALGILKALAEIFPAVTFTYEFEECGMDFSGKVVYKNGQKIIDLSGTYNEYCFSDPIDEENEENCEE